MDTLQQHTRLTINDSHSLKLAGAVSAESIEKNIGPGAADGTVPTDLEQATGLEREELLAKLEGKELFDMEPLNMTHIGTVQDPIVVKSHDAIRFVGCTGMYKGDGWWW